MLTLSEVLQFVEDNKSDEQAIRSIGRATDFIIKEYRASKRGDITLSTSLQASNKSVEKHKLGDDEKAKELAQLLRKLVLENYSWFKKNSTVEQWKTYLRSTAYHIEKLHSNGYDYSTIESVIRWSANDDFWKQNVKSGASLYKYFETLLSRVYDKHYGKSMEEV